MGNNLNVAHLNGIIYTERSKLPVDFQLSQFDKAYLIKPGVNLTGEDLSNFNFSGLDLISVNFTGAKLNGAHLQSANLDRAILKDANLKGACYDHFTRFPDGFDPISAGLTFSRRGECW